MSAPPLPEELRRHPVIAIVRGGDGTTLDEVCDALVQHGVRHLEVTTNSPGWQGTVQRLATVPDVTVGVGTVTHPDQVADAHALGARFVVAPTTDRDVGEAALARELAWYPGALTPSEILAAHRLGATAVKVFPWRAMGGLGYLHDLRGPMPTVPLIPTGGVTAADVAPLLEAGVAGLGIGSPLLGSVLVDRDFGSLAARCRAVLAEVERIRPEGSSRT